MNKFLLTFYDQDIEKKYQSNNQLYRQKTTFRVVTLGLAIIFLVKLIQLASDFNLILFTSLIIMLFLLLVQLIIVEKKPGYLRIALIILNIMVNIYFFSYNNWRDPQMAMLQGINQMGATYLLILIGEFIDGSIAIVILTIYRITWSILFSTDIQYSAFVSQILLVFYIIYYNYSFHKARRSQFILSLVDSKWEEILYKLETNNTYLFLQFDENERKYNIKNSSSCSQLFCSNEEVHNFLNNSQIDQKTLSSYLFDIIQKNQKIGSSIFNESLNIKFKKFQYKIELSVYFTNQPNILLVFRDFYYQKNHHNNDKIRIIKQFQQLILLTLKLLKKLTQISKKKEALLIMQRRIKIVSIIQYLELVSIPKHFSFEIFFRKVLANYSSSKIQLILNFPSSHEFTTFPQIFELFFLILFENTQENYLFVTASLIENEDLEIQLYGQFQKNKFISQIKQIENSLNLIFSKIKFQKYSVLIIHPKSVYTPYLTQQYKRFLC